MSKKSTLNICCLPGTGLLITLLFFLYPAVLQAALFSRPNSTPSSLVIEKDFHPSGSYPLETNFTYFRDFDMDGFGDPSNTLQGLSPTPPDGYVLNDNDCNDSDAAINPNAPEVCNLIDDNCNGLINDGLPIVIIYTDSDGDSYGYGPSETTCNSQVPAGYTTRSGDCNDNNPSVNPAATEICNSIDDDCDNSPDDGLSFYQFYLDTDGDYFGDTSLDTLVCEVPAFWAYTPFGNDCDDGDFNVFPFNQEYCNTIDDDCDGLIDDNDPTVTGRKTYYPDTDADGYGDAATLGLFVCFPPNNTWLVDNTDCNDVNSFINPAVIETCNGLVDDDCNGLVDDNDPDVVGRVDYYVDGDEDGYGAGAMMQACNPPAASALVSGDCNDQDPYIKPGAAEVCDYGVDNDCDGLVDDDDSGVTGRSEFYLDNDMDGYGDTNAQPMLSCLMPPGMGYEAGDCNDDDPYINPGMQELCDAGIDNNCNDLVDDDDVDVLGQQTWYADTDGDAYGDVSVTIDACELPAGYVDDATDCDDTDADVRPDGMEVCNGVDDDCNTSVDDDVSLPVAGAISGNATLCSSSAGTVGFEVPGDPTATTYVWTIPSGMTIESGDGTSSIQVRWTASAIIKGIIGDITVFAKNSCATGPVSTIKIDYNHTVPVRPGTPQGPARLCPGETAVYTVTALARAAQYEWTCPPGLTILSGQGTPSVTVVMDNTFSGGSIRVKAGNACGWSPERFRDITLNIPTTPPAITGPTSGLCSNNNVEYKTAGISGIAQYLWTVPAGVVITGGQGTAMIKVNFSGNFGGGPLSVRAQNGCGQGGARILTLIGKPGNPGLITGDTTICPSAQGVTYSVNTVAGASSYNWTPPSGSTLATGQGTNAVSVNYGISTFANNLTILVRASNACGESGLRVKGGISINAMHCVAPRLQQTDGLVEGFKVYPNPARDRVTVECLAGQAGEAVITFRGPEGRVVLKETHRVEAGPNAIPVSTRQLVGGVYIVTLEMADTPASLMRLMVE